MLNITARQLATLRGRMWHVLRADLVRQIRRDHPAKAGGRDDDVLHDHVLTLLQFAAKYRLERLPTIRRLVDIQLRHGFNTDLDRTRRHPLEQYALDESVRLDAFEKSLAGPSPLQVIDLDTPLPSAASRRA